MLVKFLFLNKRNFYSTLFHCDYHVKLKLLVGDEFLSTIWSILQTKSISFFVRESSNSKSNRSVQVQKGMKRIFFSKKRKRNEKEEDEERILFKVLYWQTTFRGLSVATNLAWARRKREIDIKDIEKAIPIAASKKLNLPPDFKENFSNNLLKLESLHPRDYRDCRIQSLKAEGISCENLVLNRRKKESILFMNIEIKLGHHSSEATSVFFAYDKSLLETTLTNFFISLGAKPKNIFAFTFVVKSQESSVFGEIAVKIALKFRSAKRSNQFLEKIQNNEEEMIQLLSKTQLWDKEKLDSLSHYDRAQGFGQCKFTIKKLKIFGGIIQDLIDPSRIRSNQPVKFWVPSLVTLSNDNNNKKNKNNKNNNNNKNNLINNKNKNIEENDEKKIKYNESIAGRENRYGNFPLKLAGEISGIPFLYYDQNNNTEEEYFMELYDQIEYLLNEMKELFSKIGITISEGQKVIIKSQVYQLNDGDFYEGKLHKEGSGEKIKGVGLYFPHIDNTIKGGDLMITTTGEAGCGSVVPISASFNCLENFAIVFNNEDNFHQLNSLYGYGKRLIFAFFIVDEKSKIESSNEIMVNMEWKTLKLIDLMEKETGIELPDLVRELIVSFVVGDDHFVYDYFVKNRWEVTATLDGLRVSSMD